MAKRLFTVDGGFSDGVIEYLSGVGAPGGDTGVQDAAPIGSFYTDTSGTVTHYKKITAGSGADKWAIQVSSEKVFKRISQAAHGLTAGQAVRIDASGNYVVAQADDAANSDAVGIVEEVADVNTFILVTHGFSEATTAEANGTPLYLDPNVAGGLTSTKPSQGIQKLIGFAQEGKVLVAVGMSIEIATLDAPYVPLFVTTGVTTQTMVAEITVDDADSALWVLNAVDDTNAGRYASMVHVSHDGFSTADATNADFQEFGIMEMGTPIAGLGIGVSLTGVGASQKAQLTVVATNSTDVNVRQVEV